MTTRRHRAVAALIPLALLTACTVERTGAPTGESTPSVTPSVTPSFTPSFGAPSVPEPLDDAVFQADPCASLTPAQQAEFGEDDGTELSAANGIRCAYTSVSVLYSNKDTGLSYLYGLREDGVWDLWEPFRLDGYPAVAHAQLGQDSCYVAVGLSDTRYFMVAVPTRRPGDDEACTRAREWAARVLETVKAAQ